MPFLTGKGRGARRGATVIDLQAWRRRHDRASAVAASAGLACMRASTSRVRPRQPTSRAKLTIVCQRSAGTEARARQLLTTEGLTPSAPATEPVPPKASIASSTVQIMDAEIIRNLRKCQAFASCSEILPAAYGEIGSMVDPLKVIARRLVILRTALELEQHELLSVIKVGASTYSPFETGTRRITPDVAAKLLNQYGASLDWIYCGIGVNLPGPLKLAIAQAEAAADQGSAAAPRKRGRKPKLRVVRRTA